MTVQGRVETAPNTPMGCAFDSLQRLFTVNIPEFGKDFRVKLLTLP